MKNHECVSNEKGKENAEKSDINKTLESVSPVNNQKHQKLELLVNDITIYINTPRQTGGHSNSNRQTEQMDQTNGSNMPPSGFKLITVGSNAMLITSNTKRGKPNSHSWSHPTEQK